MNSQQASRAKAIARILEGHRHSCVDILDVDKASNMLRFEEVLPPLVYRLPPRVPARHWRPTVL